MNITKVGPETLEALNEQVAELDRPVTEVPWWEFDSDDSHQQDRVSFIEQFPNGKGAEPVVTDDGVNQSGFANFWEIGPELPSQPKTPNIRTDEPEDHGKDLSKNPPQLERFSNLTETLKGIEAKHIEAGPLDNEAIAEARLAVVRAIEQFSLTRFNLGKALCAYRALFMASRGWMAAAESIAVAMGCDERTVRNIIADYERAASLPDAVIQAAHTKGIDLSQRKYRPAIAAIESAIGVDGHRQDEIDADEANRIVSNVLVMPPAQREHIQDERFVPLTREEKQHFVVRMKIRTALTNIEADRKLSVLLAALEEEMFDVWGFTGLVTVTITPRASGLTLDGRKRREDAA